MKKNLLQLIVGIAIAITVVSACGWGVPTAKKVFDTFVNQIPITAE